MTGAMTSISSLPRCPLSPACGFKPQTAIRGIVYPNLSRSSRATMSSVVRRLSRVNAAATSLSGKCVVARATRRRDAGSPPTSIITTRGVRVWSAKNSVCPENGMPASTIALFCTGAVTIAANSPAMQPSHARSSTPRTLRALAVSGCPGVGDTVAGRCKTSITPRGGNATGSYSTYVGARSIRFARKRFSCCTAMAGPQGRGISSNKSS